MMARPLALARMLGGMTFSGPKAWRGLMKEERILPHFLHSAVDAEKRSCQRVLRRGWTRIGRERGREGAGMGIEGHDLHAIDDGRGLLMPILTEFQEAAEITQEELSCLRAGW